MNGETGPHLGAIEIRKRFIFTLTTGRSGTNFLAELFAGNLPQAQVYHEQRGYQDWGVNGPDVSHMTSFNHHGNNAYVQGFWGQKLARVKSGPGYYFAETSHTLAKAGLLENLHLLTDAGRVVVLHLKRDVAQTVISLTHRADFSTKGNMWLWYLDPAYPNTLVDAQPLLSLGQIGYALWYVLEMRARGEYYRLLLADQPGVEFHDLEMAEITDAQGASRLLALLGLTLTPAAVRLPGRVNANTGPELEPAVQQYIRQVVRDCRLDPAAVAREWYARGWRLGAGRRDDGEKLPHGKATP